MRFQVVDVPEPTYIHMQVPRNRRSRHGKHSYGGAQRFKAFFDFNAESLLFIDDEQSQVAEVDVDLGQAVSTNDDIDRAFDQATDGFALLAIGSETAENLNAKGKLGHAVGKCAAMLFGENGGWH